MSLMDIFAGFRGGSSTASQAAAPGAQTSNPTVPGTPAPGSVQQGQSVAAIPNPGTGEASPLDNYKDLFDNKGTVTAAPTLTPSINIDPSKIMESAKGLDFSKSLDPTMMSNALKGDSVAMGNLLNQVAQNTFAQSAAATLTIVQKAMTEQESNFNKTVMPDILRREAIRSEVRSENPLYQNPAVIPLLETLERGLLAKFPTASPQEIKTHARTYFSELAESVVKADGGTVMRKESGNVSPTSQKATETDWMNWSGEATPTISS